MADVSSHHLIFTGKDVASGHMNCTLHMSNLLLAMGVVPAAGVDFDIGAQRIELATQ
jgi:hypothetical protein